MTLISFAQNGEDVVLWRALGHVENGFYIDVGACDPNELSVTRLFYDRGWSGINVEPSKEFYDRCVAERPRDLNLNVAVAARAGIMRFLNVPGTGLSTTLEDVAASASERGWNVEARTVPALTLANICESTKVEEIHFLKIDVEGGERAVLEGADFQRFRPWVLVIEATRPLSTERNDHLWRDLVLNAGYEQAFFDGVNLYFVAAERRELIEKLAIPPNALDDFKPIAQHRAETEAAERAAALEQLTARLAAEEQMTAALRSQLDEANNSAQQAAATASARLEVAQRALANAERQTRVLEQIQQVVAQDIGSGHPLSSDLPGALRSHLAKKNYQLSLLRSQHSEAVQHRDSLLASTSWRVTGPLRKTRTAINVLKSEPRHFLPLLVKNLRREQIRTLLPGLTPHLSGPQEPNSMLPANYDELSHRDKLVVLLRTDTMRQRQLISGT
ncbi:FkbM family methyltransferase [Roseomonas sp. ACRSG]|nr:FkbM family methyltransferase [Roseomonas sp. ACRSG]